MQERSRDQLQEPQQSAIHGSDLWTCQWLSSEDSQQQTDSAGSSQWLLLEALRELLAQPCS